MSEGGGASRPLLVGLYLEGARVLVVGGGAVASRRVARLVDAGAEVTVVAPYASESIRSAGVRWHRRGYRTADLDGVVLVVTATGHDDVDETVAREASAAGIWVNDATDAGRGQVVFPAVAEAGGVSVAVTTGGQSPALARALAADLGRDVLPVAAAAAEVMGATRRSLAAAGRPTAHPGWQSALDAGLLDLVRADDRAGAEALLRHHLDLDGG